MGKSAPKAPDYTSAAIAQGESSRNVTEQQTWANRPNQTTPFGNTTWSSTPEYDPTTGQTLNRWTQDTTLDPGLQHALDSQIDLQAGRSDLANSLFPRAQAEFGKPMNWNNFTALAEVPFAYGQPNVGDYSPEQVQRSLQTNDYSPEQIQRSLDTSGLQNVDPSQRYYGQAGDAIYNQWANRQEPLLQRQADQLDTRLRNQGLNPGDEAYDNALNDLRNQQSDARNMASYQATIGAGQEAERMYGMDMGARQQGFNEISGQGAFANSAANQALQQQLGIGAQQFGEQLGAGGFANDAANQAFQQRLAGGNQTYQQQFANQQNQYNQAMQGANYTNQLRQQQISEEMQRRGFSLNEINAIISGQQVGMPSMPGFNSASRANEVNYMGAAQNQYSAALDAANAKNAGWGNLFGGLTSLGSAALGNPFGFG